MGKKVIATKEAPAAIGPYSQAIEWGELVFTSGQIALDSATGEMVEGDVSVQTRQVMTNLRSLLAAAGCQMEQVLKTTIFVMDMEDFAAVNAVYGEFFGEEPPARATVQVAGLPKGALVEIEAVASRS
jgi:2-iminobutanoate/2-iminopropanoate deaminase